MTHPDLYLNSEAQVLDITSKDLNLYWWIGLGGEATRIQSASIYYKKPSIDLLSQSFSPVIGQFNKLNWACDVDWFNEDSSWRGWIPVYANDPPLAPWFMKMDKPMATIKKDGALLFNPSGAVNCKHDFFTVDELVKLVSNLHPQHVINTTPPAFDIGPINDMYKTTETLKFFGTLLKHAILNRLGWLQWWKAAMPHINSEIPRTLYQQVLWMTNRNYELWGYIMDIHQTWQQANFTFWISPVCIWHPDVSIPRTCVNHIINPHRVFPTTQKREPCHCAGAD